MNKKDSGFQLTPKALAITAAIESGLLPEVEGGWDDNKFNVFLLKFEKLLRNNNYLIFKVSKDRNNQCANRNKRRNDNSD